MTVSPESIPQPFQPTPTATRTADSYAGEAESYYLAGDLNKAIETYDEARRRDPTVIDTYVELVRLLVFRGRIDEALEHAETALFVEPENAAARAVRAMALDWKSSQLADQGLDRDADDTLLEALSEINRAIERDPSSAEAYAYQAEILFDLNSYEQADEAIENALLINPDSVDVQRIAGYLTEFRGYREAAIEHYQKAIELHPNLALLHLALGRTLIGAGDVNGALDSLETAIELDPENAEYLYFLGYAYFSIGERDLAADFFQQAVELKPDYPAAHCQLGLIYYQNRLWEEAIPELETGVEGYGELVSYRNAFCYYTLGLSYFYLERCEEAYPLFDLVLDAIPENGPAEEGIRLCREADAAGGGQVDTESTPTPQP